MSGLGKPQGPPRGRQGIACCRRKHNGNGQGGLHSWFNAMKELTERWSACLGVKNASYVLIGRDPCLQNRDVPLILASNGGHAEVVKALLVVGADKEAKDIVSFGTHGHKLVIAFLASDQ